MKSKLLVILGPTASGKSDLAVEIALKFNGEVISADSRQVYKGLNIGTGKITKREMRGVPHHLLDVTNPKRVFTVQNFIDLADKTIANITFRGKLPILCGGTGFYIDAVADGVVLPDVKANPKLRGELKKKSPEQLIKILSKLDPVRAAAIDPHNHVRIIRAIEIARALGKVPEVEIKNNYNVLKIGIETDDAILKERINNRLVARLKKGMIAEAKKLHQNGLSYKRMYSLGLEYRYLSLFLQEKISKPELVALLNTKIWQYAKSQRMWFKRDNSIQWFKIMDRKKMFDRVKEFISI